MSVVLEATPAARDADDAGIDRRLPPPVRQRRGDRAGPRGHRRCSSTSPNGPGLPDYDLGLQRNGYLFCALDRGQPGPPEAHGRPPAGGRRAGHRAAHRAMRRGSRFPYLSPDVLQARFRPGDGFLDPVRLALGVRARGLVRRGRGAAGRAPARRRSRSASGSTSVEVRGGRVGGRRDGARPRRGPARGPRHGPVPGAHRRARRPRARPPADAPPEARDAGRARGAARRADDDPGGERRALAAGLEGRVPAPHGCRHVQPTDSGLERPYGRRLRVPAARSLVADRRRARVAVLGDASGSASRRGTCRPASTSTRPIAGPTSARRASRGCA